MVAKFVDILINREILDTPYREKYIYVLTLRMEQAITYSILLLIAILMGKIIYGMVYAISFALLRKTTGGFHAKTFAGCLIGTSTLFFLVLKVITPFLGNHIEMTGLLLLISIICIMKYAPVNHPNLELTVKEQNNHRKWSRFVLCIELGFICFGSFLSMAWQQYIISGIMTCAVFIVIAKVIGQEVTEDEEGD